MDVTDSRTWLEMELWLRKKVTWTTHKLSTLTTQNRSLLEATATPPLMVNKLLSPTKLMPTVSNQKELISQRRQVFPLNITSEFKSKSLKFISEILKIYRKIRQVELQKKVAAEVEAEGQRILQLQAELARNQPQGGYDQGQYNQGQHQQQSQHRAQPQQNYNAQSSNVYQQQHSGYNANAQPLAGPKPQTQYLPPQSYGKKWAQN